jgi:hypothetical protein
VVGRKRRQGDREQTPRGVLNMGAGGLSKRLAIWPVCLFVLAGCSSGSGASPINTPTSGASPIITPASAPPPSAAPAPSAPVCILEMPAQHEGDDTPITFVFRGMDAEGCAAELAKMNDPVHGSATQGPARIVSTVLAGPPMCTGTRADGREYEIYGTLAAEQACPH